MAEIRYAQNERVTALAGLLHLCEQFPVAHRRTLPAHIDAARVTIKKMLGEASSAEIVKSLNPKSLHGHIHMQIPLAMFNWGVPQVEQGFCVCFESYAFYSKPDPFPHTLPGSPGRPLSPFLDCKVPSAAKLYKQRLPF